MRFLLVPLCLPVLLTAQTVPPIYQDLYSSLSSDISSFAGMINVSWNKVPYPTAFGAQLLPLTPIGAISAVNYTDDLGEIDSLKALGLNTVIFHIDFPLLYEPYYKNPSSYQQVLANYQQLFSDIRSRGLKIFVESQAVAPQAGISEMNCLAYYKSLTLAQYEAGRAANIVAIAQYLKPDYLAVITEPDTEAAQSGKLQLGTVSGSAALLGVILQSLQQAGLQGINVGAGVGTWLASYQSFIQSYAATGVQFIDMHVFTINENFLSRSLTIADMAHAAGKQVTVSEAWDYKIRDNELGILPYSTIFSRDPFSFWAPLDTVFLQTMVDFAQYKQVAVLGPFWSTYFHAYLDYNSTQNMPAAQISNLATTQMRNAVMAGQFTSTGVAYAQAIAATPDKTSPSVPGGITAQAVSKSQINLSWLPSSDDVGTAGYIIWRNGQKTATVGEPSYSDTNLAEGTKYAYTITAYDVQSNTSGQSASVSATDFDRTPPSVPTVLTAQAVSATQINLSWKPSVDDVAVAGM